LGGYYTPNAGDTITAANWRTYVRDQTVNQFATSAARASAISSPAQGMMSFRNDLGSGGGIEHYNATAWVPTGTQLIASTTLGVAAATVTFSSITGSYSSVMLMGLGSVSGVGGNVDCTVQLNADSGANYSNATMDSTQAALNPAGAFNSGQTSLVWAFAFPGSTYSANRSGGFQILWPGYSNATFRKINLSDVWVTDGGTSFNSHKRYGWWNNTAAITQILMTSGSGNFTAGSHFALYGLP
jgi:hypothetical protein